MINKFDGPYAFLSNFYESPIVDNDIPYKTNEHYYQAMKAQDMDEHLWVAAAPTPAEAKRRGRSVVMRPDWEEVKLLVMERGLRLKFADPALAEKLLATTDEELVEGNWWHDNIWGNCDCDKCKNIKGQNNLGKLLMKIRAELILQHYKNIYEQRKGQKEPCSNQVVLCGIFTKDIEKAKKYIKAKNIEIIKELKNLDSPEWILSNGERWKVFKHWNEYYRGYRYYKLAIDSDIDIAIFLNGIRPYATHYCCSLDII